MTKLGLSQISNEITQIQNELSFLDGSNSFESKRIDFLNARLDYLDALLSQAFVCRKRMHLTIVEQPASGLSLTSAEAG